MHRQTPLKRWQWKQRSSHEGLSVSPEIVTFMAFLFFGKKLMAEAAGFFVKPELTV